MPGNPPKATENNSGLDQSLVRLFVHEKDYSTYYIANYWGDFKNIYILEDAISPDNVIHVEETGTLPRYIGFGNLFKYKSLKLSGKLNGDDIRYLREMAGRDINGKETAGTLTDLDFSQASIVRGGNCYYKEDQYSSFYTSDNIIGESMFDKCHFTNLLISENTTIIGERAFSGCPLTSFRLPAMTQTVNMKFYELKELRKIEVDNKNERYQSIDDVLFTKDGKTLLFYPYSKEGEHYTIPEPVRTIGEQAFGGSNLKIVNANEGLETIETLAFDNLHSLESISLPSTLDEIGHRAFFGCNQLMTISCKAYYPPTLDYNYREYFGQPYNNFSDKTYEEAILIIPKENYGYNTRSGWKLFKNIEEYDLTTNLQMPNENRGYPQINRTYDFNGVLLGAPQRGVNIIRMSDGTVKKVLVK